MKTPKCLPALLFALCAFCLVGTLCAEEAAAPASEATPIATVAAPESETGAQSEGTSAGTAEVAVEKPAAEASASETPAASEAEKNAAAPATITEEPAADAAHPQEIAIIPFKGYDLDGKRVDVGACIGEKPVLLVFWASWCPTCKSEVPHLNAIADRFGDRMAVVGVNIAENDTYKRAKAFAAKTAMHYPTIYDGSQLLAWQYAIRGLPTVVVADKKGIIRYYGPGAPEITDEAFAKLTAD